MLVVSKVSHLRLIIRCIIEGERKTSIGGIRLIKVGADRNPSALTSHLSDLSAATVKAFGGRLSLLIKGTSGTVEIALRRLATIKTRPTALYKEVLCYRLDVEYIDLDLTHNAISNHTTWCNLLPVMSRLWDDYFP